MVLDNAGAESLRGLVFNIQRYSVHDGPGIRTLVFMKGCPLQCRWCSNPEGIVHHAEIVCQIGKCIGCSACIQVCPRGAIYVRPCPRGRAMCMGCGSCNPMPGVGDEYLIDRALCDNCGKCAKVCPTDAKAMCGEQKTVDQIVGMVERDRPFYKGSSGGVTMGGGEILSQPEFVYEVLRRCHESGINTAIETCGHGDWAWLERVADCCNTIHYDIKAVISEKHLALTGKDCELILDNLERLSRKLAGMGGKRTALIIRMPLLEGVNDSEADIAAAGSFLKTRIPCFDTVEIMPFHNLGEQKYTQLGRDYAFSGKPNAARGAFDAQVKQLTDLGIPVKVSTW